MAYEKSKRLGGVIVSHGGRQTAVVKVERYFKHPRYHKFISKSKKYKAHDQSDEYKVGDKVIIRETRPLSRDKRWTIIGKP